MSAGSNLSEELGSNINKGGKENQENVQKKEFEYKLEKWEAPETRWLFKPTSTEILVWSLSVVVCVIVLIWHIIVYLIKLEQCGRQTCADVLFGILLCIWIAMVIFFMIPMMKVETNFQFFQTVVFK